jgi:hypothetical protein
MGTAPEAIEKECTKISLKDWETWWFYLFKN